MQLVAHYRMGRGQVTRSLLIEAHPPVWLGPLGSSDTVTWCVSGGCGGDSQVNLKLIFNGCPGDIISSTGLTSQSWQWKDHLGEEE